MFASSKFDEMKVVRFAVPFQTTSLSGVKFWPTTRSVMALATLAVLGLNAAIWGFVLLGVAAETMPPQPIRERMSTISKLVKPVLPKPIGGALQGVLALGGQSTDIESV
jgi:hypothetical protein